MKVEAAVTWRGEDICRQDQAVPDHHGDLQVEGGEGGLLVRVAQALGRAHGQAARFGQCVDRRGSERQTTAPGGLGRTRVDGGDIVAGIEERGQGRQGEGRRAEKG